ncbi:hypothetical protein [Paraburkholderia diazotrophica]|uniref:BRO family, N-terminal domain n=1 Tax=Paraburkholderia diazotrophica TaxID=667676 RepID=A0A1H6YJ88_9BURK|nr:hypothetical protein [Paraburkholderia diazotrophica]SEJ37290.1 hypothetical protein SAMN05192539_10103 [Paraburkholderia diazotrophica]
MTTVEFICTASSRTIRGRLEGNAAWFEFHQVAHLYGVKREQAAKLLRQVGATGEIDLATDVRQADHRGHLLSHRAVVAVGYHMNYGRATAFRRWCAEFAALLHKNAS